MKENREKISENKNDQKIIIEKQKECVKISKRATRTEKIVLLTRTRE